jgi:hypothetical protein
MITTIIVLAMLLIILGALIALITLGRLLRYIPPVFPLTTPDRLTLVATFYIGLVMFIGGIAVLLTLRSCG